MAEINRMILIVSCSACKKQIGVLFEISPKAIAILKAAPLGQCSIPLICHCPHCNRIISANAPVGWISTETLDRFLESEETDIREGSPEDYFKDMSFAAGDNNDQPSAISQEEADAFKDALDILAVFPSDKELGIK